MIVLTHHTANLATFVWWWTLLIRITLSHQLANTSASTLLSLLTPHFNTKSSGFSVRAKHLCAHIPSEEHSPSVLAAILLSNLLDRYLPPHFESCRPRHICPIPTKYQNITHDINSLIQRDCKTHLPILKRARGPGAALQVAANLMSRPGSQKVANQFLKIINLLIIFHKYSPIWDFLSTNSLLPLTTTKSLQNIFIVEQAKPKQCVKPEYAIALYQWLNSPLIHLHRWVGYEKHAQLRSL